MPHLPRSDAGLCAIYANHHERQKNIPAALLSAISKVESGRYHGPSHKTYAWPWTINVNGQGRFFATKAEAVSHVSNLIARGINSIDVGCMQVNLRHHPHAFPNIDAAFDPQINTAYAARYLTDLKNNLGSWHKAVAHYHSAHEIHHIPYRRKVYDAWLKEKGCKFLTTARNSISPQNQYTVSYAPHGKLYRRVYTNQQPHWQLNDARHQLSKYKSRAIKTLTRPQNSQMADNVKGIKDIQLKQTSHKYPRSNLTARLIQKTKLLQPNVVKSHNSK